MKKEQKQTIQYAGCYALYMMGTSYFKRSYILTKEQEEALRNEYIKIDFEVQYEIEQLFIDLFEKEFISQLDFDPAEKEVFVQIILDQTAPYVRFTTGNKIYKMSFIPKSEKNEFVWNFKFKEL